MPAKKLPPKLTARLSIHDAIGFDPSNIEKPLHPKCKITAHFGTNVAELLPRDNWNGADIPQLAWSIFGIAPLDPRVAMASGFHDKGTNDPNTPQEIADANFVALLGPVYFNGVLLLGIDQWRRDLGYVLIRFFSVFVRPTTRVFFRRD